MSWSLTGVIGLTSHTTDVGCTTDRDESLNDYMYIPFFVVYRINIYT